MLVCDFDSFRTGRDWYMTWRQMKAMADGGLEIGNHSAGHSSGLNAMLTMEDELAANHVPKPTTIAWALGSVNVDGYPGLVEHGYNFARGSYNRPYRPKVDHPFDIPSMASYNLPDFVKMVRQAVSGRIVVICYDDVPDMKHPPCSVESTVFKEMMQYLKDNNHKVIALRDLAEFVDPAKAAKLPATAKEFKESAPVVLAEEVKPYASPGNTAVSTVTVVKGSQPTAFTWGDAVVGNWSDASRWSNNLATGSFPAGAGQPNNMLSYSQRGSCAIKIDPNSEFLLNQFILGEGCGGMTLGGNSPAVSPAAAARYAYTMAGDDCNLHNNEGLPASPFRTDDW
ncbi:MAG: hypothetical protein K9N23_06825 [Akkermansiaceae bacterium]|nr:hypothetical protein [Akkermansiaceae bacterium]